MENKLNVYLANLVTEYHKLQNYHWYVKGNDFFNAHAKLEEIYDAFLEIIDEIAEVMLMNDMKPVASMKGYLEITTIKEAEVKYITSSEIYADLLKDFDTFHKASIEIKKEADAAELFGISSVMDAYIAQFAKNIWMIKQSCM